MITIEKGNIAGFFKVNSLFYPKNQYSIKYDNVQADESKINFTLFSIINGEKIITSRGYEEITGCNNWEDLLCLLNLVNALKNNDVAMQDQTSELIDLHVSRSIQDITVINNTNIDDYSITISALAEPTNGNNIRLKENTAFYQGKILGHAASGLNWIINLDTPLDYAFTTASGCSERNENLAVDGSITPVVFSVSPSGLNSRVRWDIVRFIGQILDDTIMDDAKFGGIPALTRGIVFRSVDGFTKNIFNAKTNADLKAHMYDVPYADKAPAGLYGLTFRRTFGGQNKNGVVIRLSAITNDEFQIIIQDNLTAITNFQLILQGHVVD